MAGMGKKKMTAIHKRIGDMSALILCLALWIALFSLALIISGNVSYLPGFLLGAAGSVLYASSLYFHRIPALLNMQLTFETARQRKDMEGQSKPHSLKYLRSGWIKTMQPIAAVVLVILAVSHFSHSVSFLAALFGFFSFQISLLIYAVLISIDQLFS